MAHARSRVACSLRQLMSRTARRSGGLVDDFGNPVLAEAGPHPAEIKPPKPRAPTPDYYLRQLPPGFDKGFFESIGSDAGQADDPQERIKLMREHYSVRTWQMFLLGVGVGMIIYSASDFFTFCAWVIGGIFA